MIIPTPRERAEAVVRDRLSPFLHDQLTLIAREALKNAIAAAIEADRREVLAEFDPLLLLSPEVIGPNTAAMYKNPDGSWGAFTPPLGFADPTQAARLVYWFSSFKEATDFNNALSNLHRLHGVEDMK